MKTNHFMGGPLVFFSRLSFKLWKYYISVKYHLSDRASRTLKTASNVPKNATGNNLHIFTHFLQLQPILFPFHLQSFIHQSIWHSLSSNIPFHTQLYSPVILISCCPKHVLVVIFFFLFSLSFSGRYLGDFKLKIFCAFITVFILDSFTVSSNTLVVVS